MARPKKSVDIVKVCENCGKEYSITEWENRRRDRKFCGLDCFYEHESSFVDENFFAEPNSQMAYVLGLIITDGCLYENHYGSERISIKSIDKDMLDMVKTMMKSEYSIYNCGKTSAGNNCWRIEIANQKIVDDVKKWGITPRKTFTTQFPPLPKKYHADFVRGVFDGDGGVYLYDYNGRKAIQFCILGTKSLLDGVVEAVGANVKVKPYRKISKIMFAAQNEIEKFYNFMYYKDNVPCLGRKKAAFGKLFEYWNGRRSAENRRRKKAAAA